MASSKALEFGQSSFYYSVSSTGSRNRSYVRGPYKKKGSLDISKQKVMLNSAIIPAKIPKS